MIYGMSWIFGIAGSLDFVAINKALSTPEHLPVLAVFIALVLILAGMGYKVASVPFHMWAPDVYTGAPIPITTFLAIGSKAAGFALLMRFFLPGDFASRRPAALGSALAGVDWPQLLLVVCIITMTLGNLAALQQTNMKRLLAYSSIAQAGYALMGFVVLSQRRHPRDAVLPVRVLPDGRGRVPGRDDRRELDRARGPRRVSRPRVARRLRAGASR